MTLTPSSSRTSGGGALTPPPVPGYAAWYDPRDAASVALIGTDALFWLDLSGNGNHLSQGVVADRPTYGTSQIGGLDTLAFDGTDYQSAAVTDQAISTSERTCTVFVVAELTALAATQTLVGPTAVGGLQLRIAAATGLLTLVKDGTAVLATLSAPAVVAGTPFVAAALLTAADITLTLAGVSETTVEATTFTAGRLLRIGRGTVGAEGLIGEIGTVLWYDTALSVANRDAVLAYLAAAWGL